MIARLTGVIIEKSPAQLILDVSGVGYRAHIPMSTFETLPNEGERVTLRIHTHVREDNLSLYAFASIDEQDLFEQLISISGIGPKLGLVILSGLPPGPLRDAILDGDAARLRRIPGVGARTAERVIMELKDRVSRSRTSDRPLVPATPRVGVRRDAVQALVNLGYRDLQAEKAVSVAMDGLDESRGAMAGPRQDPPAEMLPEVLKRSLRFLSS